MTPQKRKSIASKVKKVLDDYGEMEAPVPVERILKSLGAQLRFSPLDAELSGMIYVKSGTPIIGINSLHHPNRQRFTMAHECGHLILHEDVIKKEIHVDKEFPTILMRDSKSSTGVLEIEVEANFFAAELLMPAKLLRDTLNNNPIDIDDDDSIANLAKKYKVSASAMRYRLGNLLV